MSARSAGAGLPDADLVHALFDYCPAPHQSNCLPLRAGAQVVVFTRHPSGWWDGALDGARGWFPSNHVASYDEMVPRPALDTDTDTDVDLEPSTPVPSALTDSALRLVAHVRAQRCSLYLSDADCIRSAIRDTLQDIFCLHGDDPGAARLVVAARRKHLLSVVHRLVDLAAELSANAPCPSATDTDLITCAYRVISAMSNLLEVAPVSAADPPDGSVSPRTVPMRAKGSAPVLGLRSVALQDGGDSKLNLQEINDACTSMKVVCPIFHRTILEHVRAAALSYPAEKLGAPLTEQTASPSAEKVVDATMAVYDAIHQIIPALDRICLDRQLLSSHGRRIAFLRMTRGEFVSTSHNLLSAVRQLAADDTPDDHEEKKNLALLAAPAISAAAELYHLGEDLLGQVKDIVEDMPPRPSLGNMPARPSRPIHSDQPPGSLSDDGAVRRPRPKKDRGVQPRFSLMASPPENASDDQSKLPHLSTNIESSALLPPPSPVTSSTTTTGASGSATTSLEANSLRHKLSLRGRASSPFSSRRPSMDTLLSKVRRRSALPELNHSKPCIKSSGSVNPHETPDSPDEDEEVVYASGGVVSGGTLAGLVRALIPSKGTMDEKFANTFCFTLPMFTRPADVAEMVLARWLEGGSIQRSNALAFARLWMSDAHWRPDLDDPSPLPALAKLATQAGAADLVAVVTRRSTGRGRSEMRIIASDSQIELFRTIDPPARSAPARDLYSPPRWSGGPHPTASRSLLSRIREGTAKVTDLDTGELARQLTVLVGRVYASITPAEFWVKHAPSSASSHHSSGPAASGLPGHTEEGHMKHLSIISNQIAAWVQTTILACDTIKQRKDALQYFLKLSRKCLLLHNLHVFFSLQYGLTAITVRRLGQTWKELPTKYRERAKVYDAMVRSGRNFVEYRQLFADALKLQCPFLPMVAIASADITFTLEGNSAVRRPPQPRGRNGTSQMINWVRYDRLARIVADMVAAQSQLYALQAVPEIQTWLVHCLETAHDDGGLYQRSVALEPRQPPPSLTGPLSPISTPSPGLPSPHTGSARSKHLTERGGAPAAAAVTTDMSDTSSARGYASSARG